MLYVRCGVPPLAKTAVCFHLNNLRVIFNFLQREELPPENSTARIKSPVVRAGAKQPLSDETVALLLAAAKRSAGARRNEAHLLVLLDTGVRPNCWSGCARPPGCRSRRWGRTPSGPRSP